jgi:hypothetical protein
MIALRNVAGVYCVDLGRWRSLGLTQQADYWMRLTLVKKLWDYGTQPVCVGPNRGGGGWGGVCYILAAHVRM